MSYVCTSILQRLIVEYMGYRPKQLELILKTANERGLKTRFLSSYDIETLDLNQMSKSMTEGVLYSYDDFHAENSANEAAMKYQQKYRVRYGRSSELFAALAYDAMKILTFAIRQCANPEDTECVQQKLLSLKSYQGVTGITSFDENGDVTKPLIIKTIKNGTFQRVTQ